MTAAGMMSARLSAPVSVRVTTAPPLGAAPLRMTVPVADSSRCSTKPPVVGPTVRDCRPRTGRGVRDGVVGEVLPHAATLNVRTIRLRTNTDRIVRRSIQFPPLPRSLPEAVIVDDESEPVRVVDPGDFFLPSARSPVLRPLLRRWQTCDLRCSHIVGRGV